VHKSSTDSMIKASHMKTSSKKGEKGTDFWKLLHGRELRIIPRLLPINLFVCLLWSLDSKYVHDPPKLLPLYSRQYTRILLFVYSIQELIRMTFENVFTSNSLARVRFLMQSLYYAFFLFLLLQCTCIFPITIFSARAT